MSAIKRKVSLPVALFGALLFLCFLGGGGARSDILSLLYLRPAAILIGGYFCATLSAAQWRKIRWPLRLLALYAAVIAAQLIPLPPAIWTSLPGREVIAKASQVFGFAQPWRPVSMSPDLTINSLVSLSIPAAVLLGVARLGQTRFTMELWFFVLGGLASALFAVLQIAGGPYSSFYLYDVTNVGSAVGLFANRNHQALLLSMLYPSLALVIASLAPGKITIDQRAILILAFIALLIPLVFVTGSRAGLGLCVIGIASAAALFLYKVRHMPHARLWLGSWKPYAYAASIAVFAIFFVLTLQNSAFQRLAGVSVAEDPRLVNFDTFVAMTRDFMPFGSGFGTFDPVFRMYESPNALTMEYLNHAHNDLFELAITGGLPACVLLLLFLFWWARAALTGRRDRQKPKEASICTLGAVLVAMTLLGSLVDYPIRTPLISAVFALACGWLSVGTNFDSDADVDRECQPVADRAESTRDTRDREYKSNI